MIQLLGFEIWIVCILFPTWVQGVGLGFRVSGFRAKFGGGFSL